LIAALSDLLIVVEAPEKSGALITADFALDLGIDIYAVPGSVASPQNRGCHRLIQQGARLLMDPEEILLDLGFQPKGPFKAPQGESGLSPDLLSVEQVKLLKVIGFQAAHVDKIADMSHLPTAQAISLLQGLVLEGWLEELPGKSYSLYPASRELLLKS
jgi:DNA processing protein